MNLLFLLAAQGDYRDALSRQLIRLRERVAPSVVAIQVERTADPDGIGPRGGHEAHNDYFSRPKGPCTGTIVGADGYVLTTAFNVSGELRSIKILLDGKSVDAKLIGYDKVVDAALLKFEPAGPVPVLPRAPFADVKIGDLAIVIGRVPDPEQPTINFGVISAMHRLGGDHLQSDAEMNYGNVGGPLVDIQGRLIGVTSQIANRTHWGQSGGVGFAVRGDKLDALIEKLKTGVKIEKPKAEKGRAFLGIVAAPPDDTVKGVTLADVVKDSPAKKAGLMAGDVIVEFDGKKIETMEQLSEAVGAKKPGDKINLKARRGDAERTFEVQLDEYRGD